MTESLMTDDSVLFFNVYISQSMNLLAKSIREYLLTGVKFIVSDSYINQSMSLQVNSMTKFLTSPVQCTGLVQYVAFLSVCYHYSPHPPPYIELSFSSSICWSTYSPQTSQIQAVEEGSTGQCVAVIPQGPPTLDRDEMTPPPPTLLECSIQGRDDSSSSSPTGVLYTGMR